ncbi:hypothetical protein JCM18901_690 [Psychrobacter sp. JCM 18901]|uniref:hypothetical protein n=1 Tax=Psychrobacter sp. JCM 18901 TaxID=1298609 RepID=UPI0004351C0D|nr:hypothetical protein [Psychrobacter sp. JCM 18901]GAF55072.1 hypothetical protein JCM18901_690 [Psychrobacter sp. JCM 18901]
MKTIIEYQPNITDKNKNISEKYWLRENDNKTSYVFTCRSLSKEYELKQSEITNIVRENACIKVLDCQCLDCGVINECKTRFELTNLDISNWRCDKCLKAFNERQEREWREYILEQERLEQEQHQAIIEGLKRYRAEQEDATPPFGELSLIDKLLLMAIVESLGSDNLKTTLSLADNLQRPLSPLYTMDERVLKHLFEANVLLLKPLDSLDYVDVTESGEIDVDLDYSQATFDFAYDAKDITDLRVKIKDQITINDLIDNVAFRDWCENIQLAECLSYLIERSRINGLAPPLGDKMMSLLQANLTTYSVAELCRMIWMAVESASSYSNKPSITNKHASNSIYTILQSNIDRVTNGTWKRKPFNREVNLPESAIAKVFFDDIFKIFDCGFKYTLDDLIASLGIKRVSKEDSYLTLGRDQDVIKSLTLQLNVN